MTCVNLKTMIILILRWVSNVLQITGKTIGYHFEPKGTCTSGANVYLLEVEPKPVLSCLVFEKLEPDPEDDLELPSPLFHPPLLLPQPLLVWLPLLPIRPAA